MDKGNARAATSGDTASTTTPDNRAWPARFRAVVASAAVLVASLALAQAPAVSAFAGTQVNGSGKFTVWLPDDWEVTVNGKRTSAENDEISLVAGPLSDKTAALTDEDVKDFVGDELDNINVTLDRRDKLEGFEIRVLEGTSEDDGSPILFRSLALSPHAEGRVIQVVAYGDPAEMNKPATRAIIDRILLSLRPYGTSSESGPFGRPVQRN
jgi:hypothetical protein